MALMSWRQTGRRQGGAGCWVTAKGVISLSAVPTSGCGEVSGLSHVLREENEECGPRKTREGAYVSDERCCSEIPPSLLPSGSVPLPSTPRNYPPWTSQPDLSRKRSGLLSPQRGGDADSPPLLLVSLTSLMGSREAQPGKSWSWAWSQEWDWLTAHHEASSHGDLRWREAKSPQTAGTKGQSERARQEIIRR